MILKTFHYHSWRIFVSIILWICLAILSATLWIKKFNTQKQWDFEEQKEIMISSSPITFFTNEISLYVLPFILLLSALFFWKIQQKLATPIVFDFKEFTFEFTYGKQKIEILYNEIKTIKYDSSNRTIGARYDNLSLNASKIRGQNLMLKNDQNRDELNKIEFICRYLAYHIRRKTTPLTLTLDKINEIITDGIQKSKTPISDSHHFILPNTILILFGIGYSSVTWNEANYLASSIGILSSLLLIAISIILRNKNYISLAVLSCLFSLAAFVFIYINQLNGLYLYIGLIFTFQLSEIIKMVKNRTVNR